MKSLEETLFEGMDELRSENITDSNLDAWYLFESVTNMKKAEYLLNKKQKIKEYEYSKYKELIGKRKMNIPLGYILGTTEFMGLNFCINENVLIPRQDTETLVEEVLKVANNKYILDMCTGSGCIIISLIKLAKSCTGMGADISQGALETARTNGDLNQIDVEFVKSDLFSEIKGKFDIIVSNPPYIPTKDIDYLMPEIKEHEPLIALDAGEDGLYYYKEIIKQTRNYLTANGMVYFEIGYNQGQSVTDILQDNGFRDINIIKDLTGLDRVVFATIGDT